MVLALRRFHKMTIESKNLDLEFFWVIVHHKAIGWKRTTINHKNQVDNPPKCEQKVKVNKGASGKEYSLCKLTCKLFVRQRGINVILILCGGTHVLSKESANPPLLSLLS